MFNRRSRTKFKVFQLAELVWERKHSSDIWKPAVILKQEGKMWYKIWLANGCVLMQHVDQLRGRCQDKQNPPEGGVKQGIVQWPMVKDSGVKTRAKESQEIQNGRKSAQVDTDDNDERGPFYGFPSTLEDEPSLSSLKPLNTPNIYSSKEQQERSLSDNPVVAQPTVEWCLERSHPAN
ncbi:hypothetical protein PR048_023311 [Dryococelus australis]|uniref:Uncharacterized protein n=1 Tax=Dryococelus australis TaxID=614101 RepID=A0ABQ9GTQ7_9NEOP|nr:hypothetical protein PR048_023311 [Dryococelus australis]